MRAVLRVEHVYTGWISFKLFFIIHILYFYIKTVWEKP